MITYRFFENKTEKTFLDIIISVDVTEKGMSSFRLPSWRPGRYELQNFSQNVRGFTAKNQKGEALKVIKKDKDTWLINTEGVTKLEVAYSYYARQMDAGGTWVDENQWYINFITCAMLFDDAFDTPCQVYLDVPKAWQIACSLEKQGEVLQAANYYELLDSPLIASPTLQCIEYSTKGCDFYLWFQGEIALQKERILKDFIRFTDIQIDLFGAFPTKKYHFLFQILPYRHYHGVEHAHSTVITLGPHYDFYSEKMYSDFLGVSSHELFHTWNVTRLRPVEMVPYNFFNENYFNTGFIAEGITTYYGDYMLKKSGVFSLEQYLKELNKLLERHLGNAGRKHAALTDSSVDLWLDGYKKGVPGRKVSIYVEGALAALILDLKLRLESNGGKSLDNVIRLMWERHSKGGFTFDQYVACVNEVAGKNMQSYFDAFIEGKFSAEESLRELLPQFGLELKEKDSDNIEEKRFGIKLQWQNDKLKVVEVAEGAPAAQHLERDDEIVAVNLIKPAKNSSAMFEKEAIHLHFFSHGCLKEVTLKADGGNYFELYEVKNNNKAGMTEKMRKNQWLG